MFKKHDINIVTLIQPISKVFFAVIFLLFFLISFSYVEVLVFEKFAQAFGYESGGCCSGNSTLGGGFGYQSSGCCSGGSISGGSIGGGSISGGSISGGSVGGGSFGYESGGCCSGGSISGGSIGGGSISGGGISGGSISGGSIGGGSISGGSISGGSISVGSISGGSIGGGSISGGSISGGSISGGSIGNAISSPNVVLKREELASASVYLSQVPYTGASDIWEIILFTIIITGISFRIAYILVYRFRVYNLYLNYRLQRKLSNFIKL